MQKYRKEEKGLDDDREDEDSPHKSEIQLVRFPSRVFPATLKGSAQKWYSYLKAGSISSFSDLASAFKARFRTNIPMQKSFSDLRKCKQEEQETLKNFVERFNKEAVQIENLNHDKAIEAMKIGTRFEELRDKILMKKPTTQIR
ncbi:uncharacterized protein LOC126657034 [Mercurialis annua]|uniref:uncharacterized protein LOC126657034 n=1 Tax=Mercurialis annua TaxID=3986 RepID=UPI002160C126|nr:uncharacterized protein LOC126657034 [Mercurialis annua]